jgi:hypothetical protein
MSTSTSKRYPAELRERAVRMVAEVRSDHESEWAAMGRVAQLLGVAWVPEMSSRKGTTLRGVTGGIGRVRMTVSCGVGQRDISGFTAVRATQCP